MKIERAVTLLTIKAVDGESRMIEGIATTPEPDRSQDVVEMSGMTFTLPLPFLRGHNSREPIGKVISATKTKDGLIIKAQIAAAGVAAYIDEAWAQIKAGLIWGLSIGFRSIEDAYDRETGGFHFLKSELLEISAVTVPMNSGCTITSVKSADALLLAASGNQHSVVRLTPPSTPPGVSGTNRKANMTIQEQLTQFENKRAASLARMDAIMTKAGETASTPDATEQEEHDTLDTEVKAIDAHLVRLKAHQARIVSTATPVTPQNTATPEAAAATIGARPGVITVRSNLPKGTTFSRWVLAQFEAKGNKFMAPEIAKNLWPDSPEVEMILRAGVSAGTTTGTTWASPLIPAAQTMVDEFYELLRPLTVLGRIPGLRRVPPNIVVPIQTGGGTGNWVGETQPKPVSSLALTSATIRWAKAVVMTVISEELIRYSNPSAEAIVRNSIAKDLTQFVDAQFVGNTIASVNVSPAGIRWNAPTAVASGVTAAAFLTDFKAALATFITINTDLSKLVILMSSTVALNVSTLKDTQGNFIYPNLNMTTGGNILGIPVVVSEAVGANVIFLNADEILLADDGGIVIDASNQASILMDDAPNASPTTTALVSLYQRNLVAIKAEWFVTWAKARSTSVYYISTAAYTG